MKAETNTEVPGSKLNIGGYEVEANTLKAPAGTYKAASGKWTLTTAAKEINVTHASASINDTELQQLFSMTNVVNMTAADPDADVNVPVGETLVLSVANANKITVAGTLVLDGNVAYDLSKIDGLNNGEVTFTPDVKTNASATGAFYTAANTAMNATWMEFSAKRLSGLPMLAARALTAFWLSNPN